MSRLRRQIEHEFSQADFDTFAELTGDDNPIHVDPSFASRTRFGRTVAHGMLLFSVLDAASAATVDDVDMRLHDQRLTFPAPTYASDLLTIDIELERDGATIRVAQRMTDSSGVTTASGSATWGPSTMSVDEPVGTPVGPGVTHRGLTPGMDAVRRRPIAAAAVGRWGDLIGHPSPRYRWPAPEAPPPLLGGAISDLLGTELPGRGTNWLKARFAFPEPVPAGTDVDASVRITRIRAAKDLVNLDAACRSSGSTALIGEVLVLVRDVAVRR